MMNARESTARLAELLRREQFAMADFLLALAEFDRQRLWVELGHSSLFYFLYRELGLSKGASHYRKVAAELVQRFPEIIEPLRQGRLCITSITELAKVLTPENRQEVLPRFFHCSKREAMAVSAALQPREAPPSRDVVTAVRADGQAIPSELSVPATMRLQVAPIRLVQPVESHAAVAPADVPDVPAVAPEPVKTSARREQRDIAEPLSADLCRLHITVSCSFVEKLEAARAALSHAHPGGGTEAILEEALDLLLQRHAKSKGLVEKPRQESRPSKADHVPASVKRAVWSRDGGRCQWPLTSGGVCGSTLRVQFDHVVPRAHGGPSTVGNIRLLCSMHNQLAARRVFGDDWMGRFARHDAKPVPSLPTLP